MFEDFGQFLREPLVTLSGTPVSLFSILTALVILVVARLLAALAGRAITRVFAARGVEAGIGFAVGKILRWTAMIVGALVALTTIGMNMSAVFAVFAVLLVGIGFGLQKMAENFLSGLLILVERPIRIGDFIEVDELKGTVSDIGLRATRILTRDGVTHVIPNGDLITKPVSNYTTPSTQYRIWVKVGVAYGTDLDAACDALLGVAANEPLVLADPAPEVRHTGFGDSSLDLALVVWVGNADDDDEAESALRFAIVRAFAARGIEIPFPQRDIHVRGGGDGDARAVGTERRPFTAAAPRSH